MMSVEGRRRLQEHYATLVNDVQYYQVAGHLISTFVLDKRMDDEIRTGRTEQEKMENLLKILPTRGQKGLEEFASALSKTSPWIAEALVRKDVKIEGEDARNDAFAEKAVPNPVMDLCVGEFLPDVRRTLEGSPTVCRNWKTLARSMRLRHCTIEDIQEANHCRSSNALYEVLQNWVDEVGASKATFRNLIQILQEERMAYAADEVQKLWTKVHQTGSYKPCQLS